MKTSIQRKMIQVSLVGLILLTAGCAVYRSRKSMIYPFSYDHTYRGAVSAVEQLEGWTLAQTDYSRGTLKIQKGGFYVPERSAQIVVRRLDDGNTEVEFQSLRIPLLKRSFFNALNREFEVQKTAGV